MQVLDKWIILTIGRIFLAISNFLSRSFCILVVLSHSYIFHHVYILFNGKRLENITSFSIFSPISCVNWRRFIVQTTHASLFHHHNFILVILFILFSWGRWWQYGTGASPPLIVSTYSVSGSCLVAGNAWCIANSFVPQHDCFCLRRRPFVCPFVECSDRLHLVQCCFIIHNFLIRFLTLLLLCSSFLLVLSSSASVPSLKRPATTWTIYFARSPIAPTGKPSYQDWCRPHACGAGASFMVSMEHFFRLYLFPPFSPESCVCWVSCCSGLSARLLFLSLLCLSALHVSGVKVDDAVVVALVPKVSVLLVLIRSAGEQSNSTIEFKPPTTS